MKEYNICNCIYAKDFKVLRKRMGMTQLEMANFMGVSKTTIERWEKSLTPVKGPEAMLFNILLDNEEFLISREVPSRKYPIRMWYMYKEERCTLIDVDDINQKITIKNYMKNIQFCAFGKNEHPTYADYEEFLKSRCFPETRDKMKLQLKALDLPFYDPMMIIRKTQGRMAEDDFWIMIED